MKMLFFLLITMLYVTSGFADEAKVSNSQVASVQLSYQWEESNKKIEKIEEKLDTTKEELTKYTQITDDTKERVGDISGSVDRFGVLVGLFGILMTVIVIFFSIRSTREAKLEAKEEAQKLLTEWIEKEAKSVFEAEVKALSKKLQDEGNEILKRIEDKANEQHQRHEEDYNNWKLNLNPTQEEKDKVEKEAKQIENKKVEDLTFNDYWVQIMNNWNKKENGIALKLIEKAMKLSLTNVEEARILLAKGVTLAQNENFDDAIKIYNEIIDKYKDSNEGGLVAIIAYAMFNKANAMRQMGDYDQAIQIYNELIKTYRNLIIEWAIILIAQAMNNKGASLNKLDKGDDAIKVYDELIALYKNSKTEGIIIQVVQAMINKGITLGNQNKPDEAIKIYDEIISIYKESTIEQVMVFVSQAMLNKGAVLDEQKKYDEAIKVNDELIFCYKDLQIEKVIESLVDAMGNKAITYSKQNKTDEELDTYDQIISNYKDSKKNRILKKVAQAILSKGSIFNQQNRIDEAIKTYDELIGIYENSKLDDILEEVIGGIINKIELEIISDRPISVDRAFLESLTQSSNNLAVMDMLFILENAKTSSQDAELQSWLEKYQDIKYHSWSFDELEKWIEKATYREEVNHRIRSSIETFKTHLHRA